MSLMSRSCDIYEIKNVFYIDSITQIKFSRVLSKGLYCLSIVRHVAPIPYMWTSINYKGEMEL